MRVKFDIFLSNSFKFHVAFGVYAENPDGLAPYEYYNFHVLWVVENCGYCVGSDVLLVFKGMQDFKKGAGVLEAIYGLPFKARKLSQRCGLHHDNCISVYISDFRIQEAYIMENKD